MHPITWLAESDPPTALPPSERALRDPNGLLAAGGALSPTWLVHAYRRGVFPWYGPGQPILWWTPDPRAVLVPDEFRISRSLARSIRNRGYRTTIDAAFGAVLAGCAAPRRDSPGTWLTAAMREAYLALHAVGLAPGTRSGWLGGSMASRSAACFSGNRCSPASVMPRRSRWPAWSGSAGATASG